MRDELLSAKTTQQPLIDLLAYMVFVKGYAIEFTAIGTADGHHPDNDLAPSPLHIGTHESGWAADLWPLKSDNAGDYMDQTTHDFRQFLVDLSRAPHLKQIGLAGAADLSSCRVAAGPTCFSDDGGDHIHVGAQP